MSYVTEVFMNRQIREAAVSLDIVQAAQNHKLPADSKKHVLLAKVLKDHADRLQRLVAEQTVMSPDEFFRRAFERVREMRAEAALIATMRREKRERDTLEREAIQAEMGLIAA
ncbi:hypothetical protein U8P73_36335 (plasmid) [Rhizobium beringeri]|uniref:hypothetical protein n=1 Tax=Rhizobium beringeri TaxID=3019934 RepID=UPI002DDCE207|nr:hypothetical protein [Rhizobium beringeri]WSG93619.1 hypothetical protein U8P73_36335 [Rhizobium beringeri]